MRITKVTTKVGDKGTTALGDGSKVSKSDLRIRCIGEVDELNSFIGHAKIATKDKKIVKELSEIQNNLFNINCRFRRNCLFVILLPNGNIKNKKL